MFAYNSAHAIAQKHLIDKARYESGHKLEARASPAAAHLLSAVPLRELPLELSSASSLAGASLRVSRGPQNAPVLLQHTSTTQRVLHQLQLPRSRQTLTSFEARLLHERDDDLCFCRFPCTADISEMERSCRY